MSISVAAGDFVSPIDIANRALQHIGARRITTFQDDSVNASEVSFCYDKLRRAELRRAVWEFSTRKTILRPMDTTSMSLVPAAYNAAKTYLLGAIVTFGNVTYFARGPVPLASAPDVNPDLWGVYFGADVVTPYDSKTTYYAGEVVYTPSTSAAKAYVSLASANADVPGTTPAYSATTSYNAGDTVTYLATVYQSTQDLNLNNTPTGTGPWITVPVAQAVVQTGQHWLQLDATLTAVRIIYPLGTGPSAQAASRNIYQLPHGWLREAPQDPKAGSMSYLGAPSGLGYSDWTYEGNYLVSRFNQPIIYRFAADISHVPEMDPMFCERFAARIALEVCERITQSAEKLTTISNMYKRFGDEAVAINAIIKGPEEPPEDDFITCRI